MTMPNQATAPSATAWSGVKKLHTGEHDLLNGIQEVRGSSPLGSTILPESCKSMVPRYFHRFSEQPKRSVLCHSLATFLLAAGPSRRGLCDRHIDKRNDDHDQCEEQAREECQWPDQASIA